jgi:hypothetical protein
MAPLLRLLSICIGVALLGSVPIRVPLLWLRLVRPRIFDRRGRLFGFVGQAAFAFGDPGHFLRILFQRLDAAAFVDDFFAFVEQAFQIQDIPLLGGVGRSGRRGRWERAVSAGASRRNLPASLPRALDCNAMSIPGGQNVQHLAPCASPAIVDVVIIGVVTEAVLAKSTVVV